MISKSKSPDVAITEYVLRHAARLGNKPALIDGPTGRTLTYRQLLESVKRTAAGLAKRGFKKGDVFAWQRLLGSWAASVRVWAIMSPEEGSRTRHPLPEGASVG